MSCRCTRMSFILCSAVMCVCRHNIMKRCIHAGSRCASSGVGLYAFWAPAPWRISASPHAQRGTPLSCHSSFLSADAHLMEPPQAYILAPRRKGASDTYGMTRSYDKSVQLFRTTHAMIAELDRHLPTPVRSSMVLQAAAAAAERRARDDTGCACGLKGSTAFTEAEVLELESQPGSAPVSQQNSKQEPRALLRSRSEALNSSRTCRSDSIDSLESRERKAAKLPDHMNSDVGRQAKSSLQEGVSMQNQEQEVIDLISDSEGEVELVE